MNHQHILQENLLELHSPFFLRPYCSIAQPSEFLMCDFIYIINSEIITATLNKQEQVKEKLQHCTCKNKAGTSVLAALFKRDSKSWWSFWSDYLSLNTRWSSFFLISRPKSLFSWKNQAALSFFVAHGRRRSSFWHQCYWCCSTDSSNYFESVMSAEIFEGHRRSTCIE